MTAVFAAIGLTPLAFAVAAALTFGSAFIRGLTGFGMAIILVPLLGLIIAPGEAVVLGILLQLLIGPVGLPTILADADRRSALTISIAALLTTPLGMLALGAITPDMARLLIALVAIGAFVLVLLPVKPGHRPGGLETWGTGLASGLLTGFAAMPGPPVVPYYLRQEIEPRIARASMMLVFFMTAIAGTLAAWATGHLSLRLGLLACALFGPMVAGNWLGGLAFGRVQPPVWRTIVGLVLGVAGVSALYRLL